MILFFKKKRSIHEQTFLAGVMSVKGRINKRMIIRDLKKFYSFSYHIAIDDIDLLEEIKNFIGSGTIKTTKTGFSYGLYKKEELFKFVSIMSLYVKGKKRQELFNFRKQIKESEKHRPSKSNIKNILK